MPRILTRMSGLVAVAAALVVSGCSSYSPHVPPPTSPSSTAPAAVTTLDPAACREVPPKGPIDRSASDLVFRAGHIRIAVNHTTTPVAPTPAKPSPAQTFCHGFERWGNPRPDVPPDSLLFTFKGNGTDGAQIEFLIGELTGGVLPPIGDNRPKAGPLNHPIAAQVGTSLDGTYYHAVTCTLTITAMSSARAAGSFACPSAARSQANPFAPDDDVPFDEPSTPASPTPAIGPQSTVGLSGWFDVGR